MTYAGAGVDYEALDPFKRMAQRLARETAENLTRFDCSEVEWSRGESVYLIEFRDHYLAHVEEGLGTKNLVADRMYRSTGKSYYDHIAQDTVAMIVNDLVTAGALPLSVAMHVACGDTTWLADEKRTNDLLWGWRGACFLAQCAWGGGETPILRDIVGSETAVFSGSALGIIKPKERLIRGDIQHGDAIVLLASSGIHANGLTLAREIAKKLSTAGISDPYEALFSNAFLAKLSDGRTFGEALLDPTRIYVPVVEECLEAGVEIHYAVHITGHGWRKLMRAREPFVYVIERVPKPQPVFTFIQEHGPVNDREAYATFNMGAGFALYVPQKEVRRVLMVARNCRVEALNAGYIEKHRDEKKVVIRPKNIEYQAETLQIR